MYEGTEVKPFEPTPFEIEMKITIKGTVSTDHPECLSIRYANDTHDLFRAEVRMLLTELFETKLPIDIERFTSAAVFVPLPTSAFFGPK